MHVLNWICVCIFNICVCVCVLLVCAQAFQEVVLEAQPQCIIAKDLVLVAFMNSLEVLTNEIRGN